MDEMNSEKQTRGKNGKKIIIIALVAVIVAVAAVFICKKLFHFSGIKVDGKKYHFSAENGIDDYEKINDGLVYFNMGQLYYSAIGGDSSVKVNSDEYSSYLGLGGTSYNVGDMNVQGRNFVFLKDYKTDDGISEKSSKKKIKKAGYMLYREAANEYVCFATEKGNLDWDEIEEDYNKAKKANSLDVLSYRDSIKCVFPDIWRVNYDDLDAMITSVENSTHENAKNLIMYYLATAKLTEQLVDGDIDYFYIKTISAGENNVLTVSVLADVYNVREWVNNWNVHIN